MFYNIDLKENIEHRVKFNIEIYEIKNNIFNPIEVMLDTGCYNSLIPLNRAKLSGTPLNMKRSIVIGASAVETEAYIINKLNIGSLEIKNVFMLAAAFKGELADTILMGLNIINNWKCVIHRKANTLEIEESFPKVIPNTANPYRNYFNNEGKYVLVQDA